jgi:hypothetical protein
MEMITAAITVPIVVIFTRQLVSDEVNRARAARTIRQLFPIVSSRHSSTSPVMLQRFAAAGPFEN